MLRRLATAASAAGATAAALQYRQWSRHEGVTSESHDFMSDEETRRHVAARRMQAVALDRLLRAAGPQIEECRQRASITCGLIDRSACLERRAAAAEEHKGLLEALRVEASRLSYGETLSPEERDAYVQAFGCVAWTDEALDTLAARGPIVEVGAGQGRWATQLRSSRGVEVTAYDDGSSLPLPGEPAPGVMLGVDGAVAAAKHPNRTMLLVAPPPGPAAVAWVNAYEEAGGECIMYAGEGRGGAHADEAFFLTLERRWKLAGTVKLRPFPGGAERLWVLERRLGVPRPRASAAGAGADTSTAAPPSSSSS